MSLELSSAHGFLDYKLREECDCLEDIESENSEDAFPDLDSQEPFLKCVRSSSITALCQSSCISSLDAREVNIAFTLTLHKILQEGIDANKTRLSFFDEFEVPPGVEDVVSVYQVFDTVSAILMDDTLPPQVTVLATAFLEKFLAISHLELQSSNYRMVVLAATVVATKIWEDTAIWNADFLGIIPHLDIKELNKLEQEFLRYIDYDTTVTCVDYARYYFKLREISKLHNNEWRSPTQDEQAKRKTNRSQSVPAIIIKQLA